MVGEQISELIEIIDKAIKKSHAMIATYTTIKEELTEIQAILQVDCPQIKAALERLKELKDFTKKYSEGLDLKLP